jgi:NAD-dependent deacetylase
LHRLRESSEDRRVPLPELPPRCGCGALLRPDIVWFGESLDAAAVDRAQAAATVAEVVLVVGTSSLVYPAAALPHLARAAGAFVVEINPEETPLSRVADVWLRGTAAEVVPALVGERP